MPGIGKERYWEAYYKTYHRFKQEHRSRSDSGSPEDNLSVTIVPKDEPVTHHQSDADFTLDYCPIIVPFTPLDVDDLQGDTDGPVIETPGTISRWFQAEPRIDDSEPVFPLYQVPVVSQEQLTAQLISVLCEKNPAQQSLTNPVTQTDPIPVQQNPTPLQRDSILVPQFGPIPASQPDPILVLLTDQISVQSNPIPVKQNPIPVVQLDTTTVPRPDPILLSKRKPTSIPPSRPLNQPPLCRPTTLRIPTLNPFRIPTYRNVPIPTLSPPPPLLKAQIPLTRSHRRRHPRGQISHPDYRKAAFEALAHLQSLCTEEHAFHKHVPGLKSFQRAVKRLTGSNEGREQLQSGNPNGPSGSAFKKPLSQSPLGLPKRFEARACDHVYCDVRTWSAVRFLGSICYEEPALHVYTHKLRRVLNSFFRLHNRHIRRERDHRGNRAS